MIGRATADRTQRVPTISFVPEKIAGDLDFVAMHLYPESGKVDEALETLNACLRLSTEALGGEHGDVKLATELRKKIVAARAK